MLAVETKYADVERWELCESMWQRMEPLLPKVKSRGRGRVALNTGMRENEIFKLRWPDINLRSGFVAVRDGKKGNNIALRLLAFRMDNLLAVLD